MKARNLLKVLGLLIFIIIASCPNVQTITDQAYVFTKPYCETDTAEGVVGLAEKCFKIGDVFTGKEIKNGKLTIRIAEHTPLNDGSQSSANYQEFLEIHLNYLKIKKNN